MELLVGVIYHSKVETWQKQPLVIESMPSIGNTAKIKIKMILCKVKKWYSLYLLNKLN